MWRRRQLSMFVGFFTCLAATNAWAATIYVKANATGSNNGTSWTNAYTSLQSALGPCAPGVLCCTPGDSSPDEIWVAAGTYRPDPTSPYDRAASFTLVNGCDVLGGFAGTETTKAQRNPSVNVCILSGDNAGNDPTTTDNAYHVVYVPTSVVASSLTLFDGFTITAGSADYSVDHTGGGMRCYGTLTIDRVTFTGNYASAYGGGLYMGGPDTKVTHCRFTDNTASEYGGGIASFGAGSRTISNCLFVGNFGNVGGGGIFHYSGSLRIENCTLTENEYGQISVGGSGIYAYAAATVVNSIVWNNWENQISGSASVTYSDVPGGSGTNIDANPLFTPSYALGSGSPAINAGNNAEVTSSTDLAGNPRIQGYAVDMGAFENLIPVIYVKANATGSNNGTSWTNAYTSLQSALGPCTSGDEIWVAAGTYRPDPTSPYDRAASFTLVNGCDVLGGFAGTETTKAQRNPSVNVCILSGDNAGNDPTTTDNAYHVVYVPTSVVASSLTLFDGFTITAGSADYSVDHTGGGMRCYGSLTIDRVTFTGNYASAYGGGLYMGGPDTKVTHCRFTDNTASEYGGGIASFGAGSRTISNCLFVGNFGNVGGGGIFHYSGSLRIENCTLTENEYGQIALGGSGILANVLVTVVNSIVWNNWGNQIYGSTLTTYSDIPGGVGTNIDANPLFTFTYALLSGSPAIDAGDDAEVTTSKDLAGNPRIQGYAVDMGAFEKWKKIIEPWLEAQ